MLIFFYTGNERAKAIIEKWTAWVITEITFEENGDFKLPLSISWDGLPPETKVTVTVSKL